MANMVPAPRPDSPGGDGADRGGPEPLLFVRVFGRFAVQDCGRDRPVPVRSRKASAALAYLTLCGLTEVSRERLMNLLWGDRGEEQARASLRQMVGELRAAGLGDGDPLRVDRRDIRVDASRILCEMRRLEEWGRARRIGDVATVLERLDGQLLDGLDGVADAFEEWLRGERQRMGERLLHLAATLCADDGGGHLDERRSIVASVDRMGMIDEGLSRIGLELDSRAGDLAALHRRYRALERTLRSDFDAAPSPRTQQVFRQLTMARPVAEAPVAAPGVPAAPGQGFEPPMILVQPIDVASGVEADVLLARVCAGEIEAALGGIADLRVLSVPWSAQGSELTHGSPLSHYVLRGSMRPAGEQLHISWRLTRLADGVLVWSRKSLVGRDGLGEAMDEVVARVTGAVLPALERDLERRVPEGAAGDASAYELYVRGRTRYFAATTLADGQAAAALLEEAIRRDPRLVQAYLKLARLYNTDFDHRIAGHDRAPFRARAFDLSTAAAALAPDSQHAQTALGWCYLRRHDLAAARRKFDEALTLGAYHADGLDYLGMAYCLLGELAVGERLLKRAFELNPFPSDEYFADMGLLLMLRGEHRQAEQQFEVCRRGALHYDTFRAANRALIAPDPTLADGVRAGFARIWQEGMPMTDAAIVEAVLENVPLRDPEAIALALRGFRLAGLAA